MKLCLIFCSDSCHQESVVLLNQRLDSVVIYWRLLSFLVPCQPLCVLDDPEEEERRGGGEEEV